MATASAQLLTCHVSHLPNSLHLHCAFQSSGCFLFLVLWKTSSKLYSFGFIQVSCSSTDKYCLLMSKAIIESQIPKMEQDLRVTKATPLCQKPRAQNQEVEPELQQSKESLGGSGGQTCCQHLACYSGDHGSFVRCASALQVVGILLFKEGGLSCLACPESVQTLCVQILRPRTPRQKQLSKKKS